jgi:hypothetical protein
MLTPPATGEIPVGRGSEEHGRDPNAIRSHLQMIISSKMSPLPRTAKKPGLPRLHGRPAGLRRRPVA